MTAATDERRRVLGQQLLEAQHERARWAEREAAIQAQLDLLGTGDSVLPDDPERAYSLLVQLRDRAQSKDYAEGLQAGQMFDEAVYELLEKRSDLKAAEAARRLGMARQGLYAARNRVRDGGTRSRRVRST